jgi:hypothetical protein
LHILVEKYHIYTRMKSKFRAGGGVPRCFT